MKNQKPTVTPASDHVLEFSGLFSDYYGFVTAVVAGREL